jgi:transcriptional regulator with XRE-family HTH domain
VEVLYVPDASIGAVIQQIRLIKGLTQKELATESELSCAAIAKIETGKNDPRANTISKICKGLGIKPEDLYKIKLDVEKDLSKKNMRDVIIGSGVLIAAIAIPPLGMITSFLAGALGGGAIANAWTNWLNPEVELDEDRVIADLKRYRAGE